MTIDIINYTSEQFAALSTEQILEVKRVQLSKNRLTRKLEEKKKSEKFRLLAAGIFCSEIWNAICAELDEAHAQEVEGLREGLLFYLHYGKQQTGSGSGSGSDSGSSSTPYPLDYSLSGQDRTVVVRDYYLNAYSSPTERYAAFLQDDVAKSYLGEYYAGLHDYLEYLADNA